MKVLLPGTIAWIVFTIIAIFMPQSTLQQTWDLNLDNKPQTYSTFLTSFRTTISAQTVCGIQVTPTNGEFVLVNIVNTNSKTITLAFRKTNVYFVGFKDTLGGKLRANFVKDDFKELEKSGLFNDAKIKSELPHEGGYDNIVKVASLKSRGALMLGVTSLSSFIDTIYGADYNGKNKPKDIGLSLARFALMSIQMIAEAARFKYIEGKVKDGGMLNSFTPDDVFLRLENNWDTISQQIHRSSPGCGAVNNAAFTWIDIKPQMGLLKYAPRVGDDSGAGPSKGAGKGPGKGADKGPGKGADKGAGKGPSKGADKGTGKGPSKGIAGKGTGKGKKNKVHDDL